MHRRETIKSAFTLVEIMVCIAIVTILVAIIHSAIYSAIHKSREVSCISNMKQIATAFNLYRHDYDGSDTGSNYAQIGLPDLADYIFRSSHFDQVPETIVMCPNRFFNPYWKEKEKLTKITYSVYHSHRQTGFNFLEELNRGERPPLVYCSFHDLAYWTKNTKECNRVWLGIAMDGGLVRIREDRLSPIGCR